MTTIKDQPKVAEYEIAPDQTEIDGKKNILLVDDAYIIVKDYSKRLEKKNYTVMIVYDGKDAVKVYLEFQPHLVVMDKKMDIMDGIEATKQIIDIDPNAKIIGHSTDESVEDKFKSAGAIAFVKKTLDHEENFNSLLNTIEDLLI